ncbi:MAG: hypothetical protein EA369_06780 [Bradymonadales bacterium]|nr:MAG: hypothetical protein EA369_06780 [Bradymonadales bacterium]
MLERVVAMEKSISQYARFSLFLLVYCVVIILWGAFVRISGSGDGCGDYWPLCHGEWIPQQALADAIQTWIELFHRLKSGVFGLLVLAGWFWAFWLRKSSVLLYKAATAVLLLTLVEALIGAALVLFSWVGEDASLGRWVAMSFHLGNTLLLLTALVLQWRVAAKKAQSLSLKNLGMDSFLMIILLLTAVTGAWAALASTLYPSESLIAGFLSDFSSESPLLLRLRLLHPLLAIFSVYVFLRWIRQQDFQTAPSQRNFLFGLYWIHLGFGFLTLFFLAPVWMKIGHLFLADLLWISLIYWILENRLSSKQTRQSSLHLN